MTDPSLELLDDDELDVLRDSIDYRIETALDAVQKLRDLRKRIFSDTPRLALVSEEKKTRKRGRKTKTETPPEEEGTKKSKDRPPKAGPGRPRGSRTKKRKDADPNELGSDRAMNELRDQDDPDLAQLEADE